MDTFTLVMTALKLLLINPALGGGGAKREDLVRIIDHVQALVAGGRATARALEQFANRINDMAVAGQVPTARDFTDFTERLDEELSVVEQAKERLEQRASQPEPTPGDPAPSLQPE